METAIKDELDSLAKELRYEFSASITALEHKVDIGFANVRTEFANIQTRISETSAHQLVVLLSILIPSIIAVNGIFYGLLKWG